MVAAKKSMEAEELLANQPDNTPGLSNLRDTLTPTDFVHKKSALQFYNSKSRESREESKKARQSVQSKKIELDNLNDEISGLRLGTLF